MGNANGNETASRTQLIGAKAKVGSLEAFLSELFRGFERERIEYALARDYGPLPASLDTRDLDLLVGEGQLERAYQVVESVAQTHSSTALRIDQESAMFLLVVHSGLSWGLRMDITTPGSHIHTWRGARYLNLDRAFQRKVQESGIYRLRADDIVLTQLRRDIMGQFELRAKYRSAIRSIYADNPRSFEAELGKIFGRRCAATLSEVCRTGNFEDLRVLGKQMRRAVIVRGLLREPLGTAGNILRYLGWRCREYVRPNGVMVAVIGPDGSGKGSLIEKVRDFLTGPLHFPPRVYHLRPGLLPSLGSLLLGRKDDGATVSNPHAKKPSGVTFSLLRLAYYTLDYVFGYWLLVRPYLGRKCIAAIFDRYFYDCLFDPARFRISLPPWVVRAFGIFVPRPDLVILLSADPEVVYSRKPELPLNEIHRQFSEMGRFAKYMGNCVYINSGGPLEDSAQDMSGGILSTLEKRLL
jgi:thymidylate kinase